MPEFYLIFRLKSLLRGAVLASAAGMLILGESLQAADFQWNGNGGNANWTTGTNWVGGTAPMATGVDTLVFSGSTQTTANNSFVSGIFTGIEFDATASAFMLTGNAFSVGAEGFSNLSSRQQTIGPSVTFLANTSITNTAGGSMVFQGLAFNTGNFQLTFEGNGTTTIASTVTSGTSDIEKVDGGEVIATGAWTTGAGANIHEGKFTATGSAAVLNLAGDIVVAADTGDNAALGVKAAAKVTSRSGIVGEVLGSTGLAEVTGGESRWTTTQDLVVGALGNGTLNITAGGEVVGNFVILGRGLMGGDNSGSSGTLTIGGEGSKLTSNTDLVVGGYGEGEFHVLGGATAQVDGDSVIGFFASAATSAVEVDGVGSQWITDGFLTVGRAGDATLAITDGGVVENGDADVGALAGSSGMVTVNGIDSRWITDGELTLGSAGDGTVDVMGGAEIESATAVVGELVGSTGTATISGLDSLWDNAGSLVVGGAGSGDISVTTGGGLISKNTVLGQAASGIGAILINGENSTWENTGSLTVGAAGTGTVDIEAGAVASTTGSVIIGQSAGSSGTITVSGTGTSYTVGGTITVGSQGDGDLVISDGATVSTGTATIAVGAASLGSVTVADSNTVWNVNGNIMLGVQGDATLLVKNFGTINAGSVIMGTGMSEIQIGGGDSAGYLNVNQVNFGASGNGILRINHGDTLSFGAQLAGVGNLLYEGGTTTFSGASPGFSGLTQITGGTLYTTSSTALGTSTVNLMAGRLAPIGTLSLSTLNWSGTSALYMGLGTTSSKSFFDISGGTTKTGTGRFVFYDDGTFQTDTQYSLITADGGFTGYVLADLRGEFEYFLTPTFTFSADLKTLYVNFLGADAPKVIDNDPPVSTPIDANFYVVDTVTTEGGDNTVNSLTFNDKSTLVVSDTLTVTSGDLRVNVGSAEIKGDTISTPSDLTKLGEGILTTFNKFIVRGIATVAEGELIINGAMTARQAIVQAGILTVNGTVTAGSTIVQFGALLRGKGTFFGDVTNNGTISPGNSPGTLTIDGDFTQTNTGTLNIEVESTTNYDRLVVSGNAALGGTLNVMSYNGFSFEFGQQFEFLQAGSTSGNFAQIIVPNPSVFRGRFIANDGTGTLVIAPASYTQLAQNNNQYNVAKALDGYITATGGDRRAVSVALDIQTASEYPAAFNAVAPGFYESLPQISIEQTTAQNQMIAQRLSSVRLGANGFNARGVSMPLTNDRDGKSVMEDKSVRTVITPAGQSRWGTWAQGSGLLGDMKNVNELPSYRFASGGFLVGADYRWNDNITTGVYTGYQGAYTKYSGYSTIINSSLFGAYASFQRGGFYSDVIVGGSYNNYTNRRPIKFSTINRTARSSVDGGQFTAYLSTGYDFRWGGLTFGPLASLQYTYTGLGAFAENGADSLDLRVETQNVNSLRSNLGGRIAFTWSVTDNLSITPEVRAFWQHEFLNGQRTLNAGLDSGSGPGFNYATSAVGVDSIFTGGGVSVQYGPNVNAYLYYDADVGRQDYFGQMVSGGFNWKF